MEIITWDTLKKKKKEEIIKVKAKTWLPINVSN